MMETPITVLTPRPPSVQAARGVYGPGSTRPGRAKVRMRQEHEYPIFSPSAVISFLTVSKSVFIKSRVPIPESEQKRKECLDYFYV